MNGGFKMTELPLRLPEVDENGFTALRRWRMDHDINCHDAADRLGVALSTYYRYESGFAFNMQKANEIVRMTHGAIRYRDLVADFIPEYA